MERLAAPLVPLPLLIGLALLAAVAAGVASVLAGRSAILRALALIVLTLSPGRPSLVFEDREPVKDVVPVVDRPLRLEPPRRPRRSDRGRPAPRSSGNCAASRGMSSRASSRSRMRKGSSDGTRLFEALAASVADVPTERVAGAIVITDGLAA